MTQSIVQGPEDPLLVLDHQGGSGNPSFLIQQDENAVAYIWWDQVNQVFNMGAASAGAPSLQIFSNGLVGMRQAEVDVLTVPYLTVQNGLVVNAQQQGTTVTGGITVDNLKVIGNVELEGNIANGLSVNGSMGCTGDMTVEGTTLTNNLRFVTDGAIIGDVSVNGVIEAVGYSAAGDISAGGVVEAKNFIVSSGEIKENIVGLSNQEALEVLERLSRVDVPRSVASSDGKGISLTDIVSVLTRVVKEQQETINALSEKCHSL